jgi:cobalt-zinc-cadmium efflux system membrane fusion protein
MLKTRVFRSRARGALVDVFAIACATTLASGVPLFATGCKGAPVPPAEPNKPAASASATEKESAHVVELGADARKAAALVTEKATLVDRASFLLVSGAIELVPSRLARVGPRVGGRVTALKVQQGDTVAVGAVLALVESVEVGRARAELLVAGAQLERADKEVARELSLIDSRAGTDKELLAARTAASVARIDVQAAQERLRAYGAGPAKNAGGGVALTPPVAGKVMEMNARLGQSIGAADTLFVVGDASEVWLVTDVHERFFPDVKPGDRVSVSVLALPGRSFEGRVDQLGGMVDPVTKAFRARIVLQNPGGTLLPGMSATARIHHTSQGAADRVVSVPRAAVQTVDGLPFVFVERDAEHFEMRAVERGGEGEGRVEILRGVQPGETVVGDGSFLLKSEVLREQMGKND